MIKLNKSVLFNQLNIAKHDCIMVVVESSNATPIAACSSSSLKAGREAASALNSMNKGNYPRYICVAKNSVYYALGV